MKNWVSITISMVAIIISMIALAIVAPSDLSDGSLDFDYIGAIIGVLSILVTILIGYQIYTVINVKESLKEVQQIRAEVDTKLQDKADSLTDEFKEELYQATPLIMAIASTKKDIIEAEVFRAYKESGPKQLAKDLAKQTILAIFQGFVEMEDSNVRNEYIEQLARNVNYDDVVEFYTDFAKMNDKGQYKGVEPLILGLIATLSEKNDEGNKI